MCYNSLLLVSFTALFPVLFHYFVTSIFSFSIPPALLTFLPIFFGILIELGMTRILLTQNLGPDSFVSWPPGLWHGHGCSWACGPWLQRGCKERCQVRCWLSSSGSLLRRQVLKGQLSTVLTMCCLWGQRSRMRESRIFLWSAFMKKPDHGQLDLSDRLSERACVVYLI